MAHCKISFMVRIGLVYGFIQGYLHFSIFLDVLSKFLVKMPVDIVHLEVTHCIIYHA